MLDALGVGCRSLAVVSTVPSVAFVGRDGVKEKAQKTGCAHQDKRCKDWFHAKIPPRWSANN